MSINLDTTIFGSFAEIGAGQEVARWFFQVGGASGTVAKIISAYDKEVSDHLYGAGTRYVSQPRLQAMLWKEWAQLVSELQATRGTTTRFFTYVDTVSARNYSGSNECHGWVGLRFLQQPGGEPSDVILHVNLGDHSNPLQQEAVGILGVNLIYGAFHHLASPEEFIASLFEGLSLQRIEIDLIELNGPAFEKWDRRKLHATLVTDSYAEAVVFCADGKLVPPTELLYKKALVLAPLGYETVEELHGHLIQATLAGLPQEEIEQTKGTLGLFCLVSAPLIPGHLPLTAEHIVRHADELQQLGSGVMVFRDPELYTMSAYVSRYTKSRVHFALGLSALIFALEQRYNDLAGELLEGVARLFTQNVRLSVHPMPVAELKHRLESTGATGWRYKETNGMVYAEDLDPEEPLNHLYRFLLGKNYILSVHSPH
ncbi:MAG: hypothetical protein JO210_06705 [Acidobacteriaceae bacterium]|nr:hypothetical protein [Acidobacteriaceae bacterium]